MTQVLIIGYVWPEPCSSAAGTRMMELINLIKQQDWQLCFASPAAIGAHAVDLTDKGIAQESIQLNDNSFDTFITELKPNIVIFDRYMMEEQFGWRVEEHCPQAIRILDTEDLHCLRQARHTAFKKNRPMQSSDLLGDLAKREIAAILRCDLSLMISEVEIELLTNTFNVPAAQLFHLPFMLTPIEKTPKTFSERQHFISIGNFRHAPNWDAVLYLKQQIWPAIRKALPSAELHVYGAYPPPKATALHDDKMGFLVKGWAEDAFEVLSDARILLAPLRFGAGIKGKLADAMLTSTPSITTDVGTESMSPNLPWPGLVENEPTAFAEAAISLYTDEDTWCIKQQCAAPIITERYNKEVLANALLKTIETIKNNLEERRMLNFTGAMLRHHHHRSTKFMSQWIECKNKLEQHTGNENS
jgi:glycosyltransferase involved in cell wall biosynthesis